MGQVFIIVTYISQMSDFNILLSNQAKPSQVVFCNRLLLIRCINPSLSICEISTYLVSYILDTLPNLASSFTFKTSINKTFLQHLLGDLL